MLAEASYGRRLRESTWAAGHHGHRGAGSAPLSPPLRVSTLLTTLLTVYEIS